METVKLTVPSNSLHAAQILTGFLTLKEQGWDVEVTDNSRDAGNPFYDLPVVLAPVSYTHLTLPTICSV